MSDRSDSASTPATQKAGTQPDRELFRLLVDEVQDYAMFLLSPNGTILSWNSGARRINGYEPSEIIGKHFSCFYSAEDIDAGKPQRELDRALAEGRCEDYGWRLRKDGTRFWAHVTMTALHDEKGQVVGFAKVTRDSTDRMRAEQALRELSSRLLRLQDQERQKLSHDLHDVAGPVLSSIVMNLSVVERDASALSEKSRAALNESTVLARRCVQEIRTMSYLLHPPLLTEVGLASAVQWLLDGFSSRSGIQTRIEMSAGLGRLPRHTEVSLFRVVQECLTNIHRHTNSPTAAVRIFSNNGSMIVEITDQGRGFAANAREGLGFAGMRERLNEVGGILEVLSNEAGTTVRAIVPMPSSRTRGATTESGSAQKQSAPAASSKTRLLLVDDHEVVRRGLVNILQCERDFEVCAQASSGEDAISEADRASPDIIIMDFRLPGIDGLEATREILKSHPAMDVLIFTVDESEQVLREALKAGARGCLTKTDAGVSLVTTLKSLVAVRAASSAGPSSSASPV